MPTVDLTTPPPPPPGLLEALPRRVTLTLPELRLVAERAGGAPLPFDPVAPGGGHALDDRLGASRPTSEAAAYAAALDSLRDPLLTLERRGLLGDEIDEEAVGLVGAVGLLATPETAVDIDVAAAGVRACAWHRHAGDAVATLSTVDGVVFELAWFPSSQWPTELGRVAMLPGDLRVHASAVPGHVEIPYELADAAAEALSTGRADLVPVLAAQHAGTVTGIDGPLTDPEVAAVLTALAEETQGRLRVLVAGVSERGTTQVGVVSWTLLADGWHALRPRSSGDDEVVEVDAVEPTDLAPQLAPVLAEVAR